MARSEDFDSLLDNADELLKYLGHLNKLDHISTVTELIRCVSSQEGTINRQGDKMAAMDQTDRMLRETGGYAEPGIRRNPSRMGDVIQLPPNTRKVSIEL